MSASPTFVCEFVDGVTTRMTTHAKNGKKLDVARGIRLAQHAYRSRTSKEPPAIERARYERDGDVLATYSSGELEKYDKRNGTRAST